MTRVDDARIAASYAARRMLFVARVSTTPALFFVFVDEERRHRALFNALWLKHHPARVAF
jgi:hypothetical protein